MNLKLWLQGVVVGEAGAGVVKGAGVGDFSGVESAQYHRVSVDCSFCRFTALIV